MENKYRIALILSLAVIAICFSLIVNTHYDKKIDCDNIQVVYLKPSEIQHASEIANKINGVVVIPELNQLVSNTEILHCENFDYTNYIN